jgi:regulator of ribonuclease activity A
MEKTTDLSDRLPDAGILPYELRNFGKPPQFSGPAVTVKCFEDNSRIKELSQTPGNGRVLVVDGGGSTRCALFGDIIAIDLHKNGWAGAVIYGCVRDAVVLATVPIGIKALGTHPRRTIKQNEGQVGGRIVIGGVPIAAGDEIVSDEDGIVVLAKHVNA